MLKKVRVEEAVGLRLAHDMTQIVPGQFKGPAFRRGQILREEEIPQLLAMGKEYIYILELEQGELHEEEAALRIARAAAGEGVGLSAPREGRINLQAEVGGLLRVKRALLEEINTLGELILATLHDRTVCAPGQVVAATRIIPLVIAEPRIAEVEALCQQSGPVVTLVRLATLPVGLVITGGEIFHGRIQDRSAEIVRRKVEALGSRVAGERVAPDDADRIAQAIQELQAEGCRLIVTTGGMSVDPDDVTAEGIARSGARIICYGAPVLPGSMLLYALWGDIPILGVPACVIHDPTTTFDLVLPRILAGEILSRQDFARMGHGGLCLHCRPHCTFPVCPFGKS
ncbi:MAG: molybdopterin-binding protein [Candidatus Tectomicrobia bacterium]|uniref:Molybdopterin-binding protein n=1 Tax=Tectimicrobiota bacterium TaxID=2528274 RepID=A0A932CMY0_UNCTE|nr:molybdopterin-binding protein [Candidatus Tectomicrobia bacterium]